MVGTASKMFISVATMLITLAFISTACAFVISNDDGTDNGPDAYGTDYGAILSSSISSAPSADSDYSAGTGNITYVWGYNNTIYSLSFDLPQGEYDLYVNYSIERNMTTLSDEENAIYFVTSNESVVVHVAECLLNLTEQTGLDGTDEANMVLAFVQTLSYSNDTDTHLAEDYWSFPVETLHDGTGDCEDKSFLYSSLMEALGYQTALLLFDDHMAVGVYCTNITGWYYAVDGVKYYYSETTTTGWTIGEMPNGYSEATVLVISEVDADLPSAPIGLSAIAGDGEATLSWTAPISSGNADIDYYVVYQNGVAVATTNSTSITITNLTNGQMYRFNVAAHTSTGMGDNSTSIRVVPYVTVSTPSSPTDLSVTEGEGSVTLSWNAPDDDGGADIDYYVVYVNGLRFARTSITSITITGLTDGEEYEFTVAAHNQAGTGEMADSITAEPTAGSGDAGTMIWIIVILTTVSTAVLITAIVLVMNTRKKKRRQAQQQSVQVAKTASPPEPTKVPSQPQNMQPLPAPEFCPICGSQLMEGAVFCSRCGNRVK